MKKVNMKENARKLTGRMVIICLVALVIFRSNSSQAQEAASQDQILILHNDKTTGKVGYADKQEKVVIPCIYETAMDFVDNLAFVRLNKKWGMIDKTGKTVVPHKYEMLGLSIRSGRFEVFSEGLARAQFNGKWGYLDKTGKEVIPCIYDEVNDFSNGKAEVKLNEETFNIDKNGNRVE